MKREVPEMGIQFASNGRRRVTGIKGTDRFIVQKNICRLRLCLQNSKSRPTSMEMGTEEEFQGQFQVAVESAQKAIERIEKMTRAKFV
jgi:hypothetical protein